MTAALPLEPFDIEDAIRDAVQADLPAMRQRERIDAMCQAVKEGFFAEFVRNHDERMKRSA